jgi:flap endonuclease-1
MGIEGFHTFVKKRAPHVYRQIHLSEYAGKRIAVDISGLIYKYKIINKDRWLDSFMYLVTSLRRNRVHPIFVFDGEAPVEKNDTKTKRGKQRNLLNDKIFSLREGLDKYYSSGEISEVLTETMEKIVKKIGGPPPLGKTVPVNITALEKKYTQIESQVVHWSEEESEDLYKLFDLAGIQYIIAPTEAESMCASMALEGHVDAVISNDSDVCVYGVKKFLYEINGMTETCTEIDHDQLIEALKLTKEEFVDFCIMCGCDYNHNMPGVGPVNAYKLITEHHSIDNLPVEYNVEILNHIRSREIFSTRYPYEDEVLCTQPSPEDLMNLYNFLKMKNSRVKYETIVKAFEPVEIVFE